MPPARQLAPDRTGTTSAAETAYALEKLQARLGVTQTGVLTLGQAVFLPAAARITGLGATTVLGGWPARICAAVGELDDPVVTIDLDAAQQTEVKAGDHVTITLPDGEHTPGVVSSVSTVATASSSDSSGDRRASHVPPSRSRSP